MAPSRGCSVILKFIPAMRLRWSVPFLISQTRCYSSHPASSLEDLVSNPASKHQIYVSRSNDPYVNLSIEHFLLQKTPPDSNVLFLYTNRPSVVIGRNQNPWLEVNLGILKASKRGHTAQHDASALGDVLLVRRRSGGGTVFHDEGNVNYCAICPPAEFTRDKHAEMVVRALRRWSGPAVNARVNERHDIVLDQGSWDLVNPDASFERSETHESPFQGQSAGPPLKISGSAYKLTRLRALHHGTCLLASPNLGSIHAYLDSPARPFMKARGVESVRSPVGNLCSGEEQPNIAFEESVIAEFGALHGIKTSGIGRTLGGTMGLDELCSDNGVVFGLLSNTHEESSDIGKGLAELKVTLLVPNISDRLTAMLLQSRAWIYSQTPQFILSSHPCAEDPRKRPPLPSTLPPSVSLPFTDLSNGNNQIPTRIL